MTLFKKVQMYVACSLIALASITSLQSAANAEEGYPVYYNNYLSNTYNNSAYQPTNVPNYQNNGYNGQYGTNPAYQKQSQRQQPQQKRTGEGYTEYQIPEPIKQEDANKYLLKGPLGLDLEFMYGRTFSDFEFQLTPENGDPQGSILEWDDMVFDEWKIRIRKDFSLDKDKKNKLFAFAEYRQGSLVKSGDSRDDDMRVSPYYYTSIGGIEADTDGYKVGLGWTDAFKAGSFKVSPVLGYTNQNHNLTMTDQKYHYPDPVYYYDENNNIIYTGDETEGYEAVCAFYTDNAGVLLGDDGVTPLVLYVDTDGDGILEPIANDGNSIFIGYDGGGDCSVGGTGAPTDLPGPVQVYNTNWAGFFVGAYVDKVFDPKSAIQFYGEFAIMDFEAEANWLYRTDLGGPMMDRSKAIGYTLEMTYKHKVSRDMNLTVNASYETFGLFGSAETDITWADGSKTTINDSMLYADWNSFGLHVGLQKLF